MKVKLFQSVVSISAGSSAGGDFRKLEDQMNEFLLSNPSVRVVDIKLASNAAPVANHVTNYGLVALLIYEEA